MSTTTSASPSRTARLGFVGCGSHATNNLYPMLAYARATLAAVCDRAPGLAERNARIYGAERAFTDVDTMLAETDLDGVLVVGPPELHLEAGRKALAAGRHLFVEKPPAPDLADTRELAALATERQLVFMPGFMKRFGMTYARMRALIDAGTFEPTMGFFKYAHWPFQDLRPMLAFMSCHIIDLARFFFGDVAEVDSRLTRQAGAPSLAVTLRFTSGKLAQLMLDSSQPRIQERVEISGRMAGGPALLIADNVDRLELHRQGKSGIDLLAPTMDTIAPDFDLADIQMWRPDYGIPNMGQTRHFFQGFAGEVREFTEAILEGRPSRPGAEDAIRTMEIVEALTQTPDGVTTLDPA